MQRERIAPPRHVLPAAEVGEQLRRAGLANESEIVEAQLLEAAPKAAALPDLARDQEAARAGSKAREIDVALLRLVRARRQDIERPASAARVEHPELPPALERLHGEHQAPALCDRLRRGDPDDPVGTAPDERRARTLDVGEGDAGL